MTKRFFDISLAIIGIVCLFPVMLLCGLLVKITSKGPVFYAQTRIGKEFKPFRILKFRSMIVNADKIGGQVTVDRDPRITFIGRWMRKAKLDELPQLFNVLCGQMSLVGPRPEVQKYVDLFHNDFQTLLTVRPGVTDLASIKFRHEEDILAASDNPMETYVQEVLPAKIELGKQYVSRSSVSYDVWIILATLAAIFGVGKGKA